jgi:hypothetical protein
MAVKSDCGTFHRQLRIMSFGLLRTASATHSKDVSLTPADGKENEIFILQLSAPNLRKQ